MRIALVSQEYPPETAHGGIGTQTFAKAHWLTASGHEVYVLSCSLDERRHEYRDNDVNVIRIPGYRQNVQVYNDAVSWLMYSVEVAAELNALHHRQPMDIIDFPDWGSEGYIHLLNKSEFNHIPAVIHLHGPLAMFAHKLGWPSLDSEFYRAGRFMEETSLRLADGVFSSSRCSAEICADHYGVDVESVPVLHTGINLDRFRLESGLKNAQPTIIFVGKLTESKGVDTLVDAACSIDASFPGLRVLLIGPADSATRERLLRKAEAAGASNLLSMLGFVDHDELPAYFSRGHVFAAPSRFEGGPGFVYLEAMACGLPVIGSTGSGAEEVVRHGETGFLVPPDSADALASVLADLLSNPAKCIRLGEQARLYVEAEADSQKCLRNIEEFYLSVINRVSASTANSP